MHIHVAGGARADALAGALDGDAVPVSGLEQSASDLGIDRGEVLRLVHEGDGNRALPPYRPQTSQSSQHMLGKVLQMRITAAGKVARREVA